MTWSEFSSSGMAHPDPAALLPSGMALARRAIYSTAMGGRHCDSGGEAGLIHDGDGGGGNVGRASRAPVVIAPRKPRSDVPRPLSPVLLSAPKDATALSGANKRPWEDLDLNPTNRQLPTVRHRAGSGTPAVPGMTASEALSPRKKKQTPAVAPLAGGSNTPLSLLMKLASRAPTWVVILDYSTTSCGDPPVSSRGSNNQSVHSSLELVSLMRSGLLQVRGEAGMANRLMA